ncbi:MAG: ATP-binding protein [bacterium]|nr:ATP-binding protein [bacterium]
MRELSLHVLDLIQNSVEAGASRVDIYVAEDSGVNRLTLRVTDDGKGMDPELLRQVLDPFVTTRQTRRMGLGLPLLEGAARQTGGSVAVTSVPGQGTTVTATFGLNHLDRAPLGDMAATVMVALAVNPELKLGYRHRREGSEIEFDTEIIERQLGRVSWGDPRVAAWTRETIRSGLTRLSEPEGTGPAHDKGRLGYGT